MAEMSGGATAATSSGFIPLANNNHAVHTIQKVARKTPPGKHHYRKLAVGGIVSVSTAACFVGVTECIRATYATFEAPFFVIYFSTTWWIVVYPAYVCARAVVTVGRPCIKDSIKESFAVYAGKEGSRPRPLAVLGKVASFSCLWTFSCYVFLRALGLKKYFYIDVVALFASLSAFVFVMAWIILQRQFMAMRIIALIIAMIGISIITYMRLGSDNSAMWGAITAIVATWCAACYKVLFKKFFSEANACQMSMFLSCLGLFNLVGMFPVIALFYFTHAEPITWDAIPWLLLCGVAGFTLAMNIIQMFSEAWTYPWFLQVSFILAIPLSAGAEVVYNPRFAVDSLQVTAYTLIALSFPLNMLPRDWHDRLAASRQWLCLRNTVASSGEEGSSGSMHA